MIEMSEINALARRIGERFHPDRVILFGSYAWGTPTPDSDVDLLVVLPFQGKSWQMATEIRRYACASFPMDLLVRSPEQLRQRLVMGDSFLREITQRGKVLYEA
jgi:predicted nucleotidyltransferase